MTAHLALNLLWLRLFLRDDAPGHAGAVGVGFLATGLHQIVFHPLFALPFLMRVAIARRWRLALFYFCAYAAIGLFWSMYWRLLLAANGVAPDASASVGGGFMIHRIAGMLQSFGWSSGDDMAKNLVRFIAWQNPLLAPLACLAAPCVWRGEGLARPLAAGIALTLLVMFVLMPYQGHGWGYRYLHGLLGGACLLAAQGWVRLTGAETSRRVAQARAVFVAACIAALVVLIPARALEAHRFLAPYAEAFAEIRRTAADVVLVDDARTPFAADLVRNDPYLRDRPKVLLLRRIAPARLRALCRRHSVAVFSEREAAAAGLPTTPAPTGTPAAAALLRAARCPAPSDAR
jgi:hypothetical protein